MSLVRPARSQPRAARACDGPLASCSALGRVGVGEPVGRRPARPARRGCGDVEVCGVPVGGRDGQGAHVAGAAGPLADDVDAGALPGAVTCSSSQAGDLGRRQHVAVDVEARLGLGGDRVEGLEQPLPQHPELEAVEHLVHLLAVPGLAFELVDRDAQRHVADQLVEPAVAQHAVEVLAEGVADLAADLVDVGDDPRQVAVGGDPLRRRLGPDAGHAGEVVGRLADQRREVAVALRGHEVALRDGGGVHPPHVGDAPHGVDHRHVVGDELEHVAVARDDDDLHALRGRLRREGRDDVVGLVARAPRCSGSSARRAPRGPAGSGRRTRSGVALRPALYSAYSSSRKVCRDRSKATPMWVGSSSRSMLMSIDVKP